MEQIAYFNERLLRLESVLLNEHPRLITNEQIQPVVACGVSPAYAYSLLLASAFGISPDSNEEDRVFFHEYLLPSVAEQKVEDYQSNPYYASVKFVQRRVGDAVMKYQQYARYEAFPCGDMWEDEQGRLRAPLGFFDEGFRFPAVAQSDAHYAETTGDSADRIWMTITPNEISTMESSIRAARGHVLVMGLGLGYYTFMVSQKADVERVTVVEKNPSMIRLFETEILPQFPHPDKIEIVCDDAFHFIESTHWGAQSSLQRGLRVPNCVFSDLWHDVSDGIPLYQKLKSLEYLAPSTTEFHYWIEPSMKLYLR